MGLGLTGKAAVVTGASKGIGLAIARTLAEEGVTVVAGARSGSIDILVNNVGAVRPRLADLVTLLAADRLGNLTGSNIVIDGGLIQTL